MIILMILSIITLALAPFTGHYRGFYLCITLGSVGLVTSIVYIPLIHYAKTATIKDIGRKAIQDIWILTSMGIGYMVTAFAPYFNIVPAISVILFLIGAFMSIYGAYNLIKISKRTGLPLAV